MTQTISAPVIRALLLTDLCDSVSLVERIGDVASADLFRSHDLLVLELQQRWSGRLIDRSDGMLLLFERPLHGIGFALDYMAGLVELGRNRQLTLQARAGLHVGEVLLWENSPQAIGIGAKPLEVEGLAKPMAARLMALARPGQVLVSAVAEALARRASREELGTLGDRLVWKSHGRWQFKGVPKPQEVYEVGEAGKAPLRQPLAGAKAQPVRPFWRQPLALAMQAVFVVGLGLGGWYLTRSEPAVAFAPRDWLVLAALQSEHTDAEVNQAVEQALRMALEQSSYLNLLSREQMQETMAMARQDAVAAPTREQALDVALRQGAQAVLVPRLDRSGAGWEVLVELVEPTSGRTVYKAAGKTSGMDNSGLMLAVDEAARELRSRLGEALENIQATEPLPKVTTASLSALRAYGLAENAAGTGDYLTAEQLFGAALEADPDFALAHMGQARLLVRLESMALAQVHLDKALQHRDRLPLRERLYLDAWKEELSQRGWPMERWEALARLFPDFAAGPANASWYLLNDNRFASSGSYAKSVGYSRHPMRGVALMTLARAQLGQGDYAGAMEAVMDMEALSGKASYLRGDVLAAQGKEDEAVNVLVTTLAAGENTGRTYALRGLTSVAASKGDCREMIRQAGLMHAEAVTQPVESMVYTSELYKLQAGLCGSSKLPVGDLRAQGQLIEQSLKKNIDQGSNTPAQLYLRLLALAYVAQRGGQPQLARKWLEDHHDEMAQSGNPMVIKLLSVVHARNLLELGQAQQALDHLSAQLDGAELYQARVVMRDAYRVLGRNDDVATEQAWLRDQAGRAWAEVIGSQQLQPLNVMDLAAARRSELEAMQPG